MLLGAAVAPTDIQPSSPRPGDFDEYWSAKIAQLKGVPENAVLTGVESETVGVDLATIRMDHLNGAHVWGYIAKPNRPGTFPALRILQCKSAMGFIDDVASAVGIWAAFNQIRGAKEAVPMIDSHHNHLATTEQQAAIHDARNSVVSALVAGRPASIRVP